MLAVTQNATGLQRPQAQNLLGRFLFTGWEMHERSVSVLSGGERRRLALALVVASGANFLVLDEPTNHLDLESREALEAALDAFPGTVLLVSHDRALLDAIADRTLGSKADDFSSRRRVGGVRRSPRRTRDTGCSRAGQGRRRRKLGRRTLGADRARATRSGHRRQEAEIEEPERKLADDWADVDVVAAHRRARDELQSLLIRWEQLFERSQA